MPGIHCVGYQNAEYYTQGSMGRNPPRTLVEFPGRDNPSLAVEGLNMKNLVMFFGYLIVVRTPAVKLSIKNKKCYAFLSCYFYSVMIKPGIKYKKAAMLLIYRCSTMSVYITAPSDDVQPYTARESRFARRQRSLVKHKIWFKLQISQKDNF